jgi:hypothetical protein
MVPQKRGRIITIGADSVARGGGRVATAAYTASKGAVVALTRNIARDLLGTGVSVNCVNPGPIDRMALATRARSGQAPGPRDRQRRTVPGLTGRQLMYGKHPVRCLMTRSRACAASRSRRTSPEENLSATGTTESPILRPLYQCSWLQAWPRARPRQRAAGTRAGPAIRRHLHAPGAAGRQPGSRSLRRAGPCRTIGRDSRAAKWSVQGHRRVRAPAQDRPTPLLTTQQEATRPVRPGRFPSGASRGAAPPTRGQGRRGERAARWRAAEQPARPSGAKEPTAHFVGALSPPWGDGADVAPSATVLREVWYARPRHASRAAIQVSRPQRPRTTR